MIEKDFPVTKEDTALAVGSGGLAVLATPRVAAMVEAVCFEALEARMQPGTTTVGTKLTIDHRAASGIGATVRVTCEETQKEKCYEFAFRIFENEELLATGTHQRVVVDTARFLKKVNGKKG
ncbi:dihydrolipoamide acyltransferase [Enterococcus sp.]|jgi:fluoroacetyl-CoA thioesterase|uniref:thioesterase family protein n=1 Tax=Enterococcus sp. TaxID=35783 RepID=UPI0025C6BBA0|nr:dihydrolipoamide acyltransferase [Enterococcus sp.]